MSSEQRDITWEEYFSDYRKALARLTVAINIFKPEEDEENFELEEVDELLKEGFIHRFEYTSVMAWNSMKAYVEHQEHKTVLGPANVIRQAHKLGLVSDPDAWMDVIKSLNITAHTYSKTTTEEIFEKLIDSYYALFLAFESKMRMLHTAK